MRDRYGLVEDCNQAPVTERLSTAIELVGTSVRFRPGPPNSLNHFHVIARDATTTKLQYKLDG
jgi:hypothetical protein